MACNVGVSENCSFNCAHSVESVSSNLKTQSLSVLLSSFHLARLSFPFCLTPLSVFFLSLLGHRVISPSLIVQRDRQRDRQNVFNNEIIEDNVLDLLGDLPSGHTHTHTRSETGKTQDINVALLAPDLGFAIVSITVATC